MLQICYFFTFYQLFCIKNTVNDYFDPNAGRNIQQPIHIQIGPLGLAQIFFKVVEFSELLSSRCLRLLFAHTVFVLMVIIIILVIVVTPFNRSLYSKFFHFFNSHVAIYWVDISLWSQGKAYLRPCTESPF